MPINEPVNYDPPATAAAIMTGGTAMAASLDVLATMKAEFSGRTSLSAALQGTGLSASFDGRTDQEAFLRIGAEANIFLSASFAGRTDARATMRIRSQLVSIFRGSTEMRADFLIQKPERFGFTFFVDIADSLISEAQNSPGNYRQYSARLLVDGSPVPILRAQVSAPAGKLGTELTAVLALPDIAQVSSTALIDFEAGIFANGAWQWIPIIQGGKLSGRGARYANQNDLPADSVEISVVDVMGDRWNRAPRQQRILYDPALVDPPSAEAATQSIVYDSEGHAILPVYQAVFDMRLRDVLAAAYVDGCGFDRVQTNIPNFPVDQAVFSLQGGYDGGVRGLLSPYEPVAFVVGNDLWIVSLILPLPAGMQAREWLASNILSIDDSLPRREPANGILVRLKSEAGGEFFTTREDTKTVSSGSFGSPGYTETDTTKSIREYRSTDQPDIIRRSEEALTKVRVLDYQFNEVSIEQRTATYDSQGRPTGYKRTLDILLPDPASETADLQLQRTQEETQRISYGPHPLYPQRDMQTQIRTDISGLILSDPDNTYLDEPYRIPMVDAHKSGYISPGGSQTAEFGAIRTIIETMRLDGGMLRREKQVLNHVANVPEDPVSQVVPGDTSFDRKRSGSQGRTVLLTIDGTAANGRRVPEFDGTSLPVDLALDLARKKLQRLNQPPREIAISLPFVDFTLRRGSDLKVQGRNGYVGTYIVDGYQISFEMRAAGAAELLEATMSINGKEVI